MALRQEVESVPDDCRVCQAHARGYGTGCTFHDSGLPAVSWPSKRPGLHVDDGRLRELYATSDPSGWDGCRQRREPFGQPLHLFVRTEWSDFDRRMWTPWDKWLRRYSLGFMRHPSDRDRKAAMRFPTSTRKSRRIGDVGIVEPVKEACRLADLTDRQIEIWTLAEGRRASQRQIADLLRISQPMVHRHLTGARERLAREWGVITSGLVIEGVLRGCAWRYRGFECRSSCQQKQISS